MNVLTNPRRKIEHLVHLITEKAKTPKSVPPNPKENRYSTNSILICYFPRCYPSKNSCSYSHYYPRGKPQATGLQGLTPGCSANISGSLLLRLPLLPFWGLSVALLFITAASFVTYIPLSISPRSRSSLSLRVSSSSYSRFPLRTDMPRDREP